MSSKVQECLNFYFFFMSSTNMLSFLLQYGKPFWVAKWSNIFSQNLRSFFKNWLILNRPDFPPRPFPNFIA